MDLDSRFRGNDREEDGDGRWDGEDGNDDDREEGGTDREGSEDSREEDGDDKEEDDAVGDDDKEGDKNDNISLICPSNSSEHIPLLRAILVSINIPRATASP